MTLLLSFIVTQVHKCSYAAIITYHEAPFTLRCTFDNTATLKNGGADDSSLVVLQTLTRTTSYRECYCTMHRKIVTFFPIEHISNKFLEIRWKVKLDIDIISVNETIAMSCSKAQNCSAYVIVLGPHTEKNIYSWLNNEIQTVFNETYVQRHLLSTVPHNSNTGNRTRNVMHPPLDQHHSCNYP